MTFILSVSLFYILATMEQEHRAKILSNIDRLVNFTNYDALLRVCLEHQLLYKVMVEKIQVCYLKKYFQT